MGWGSATGLRVIGVATKKSFPARSLQRLSANFSILPLPRSHYSVFLPEILICCHRYKNIVSQYSILHYIIEGMAQKARQISGQRMKKLGQNEKNERHSAAKNSCEHFSKRKGFILPSCTDFVAISSGLDVY